MLMLTRQGSAINSQQLLRLSDLVPTTARLDLKRGGDLPSSRNLVFRILSPYGLPIPCGITLVKLYEKRRPGLSRIVRSLLDRPQ